MTRLLSCLLGAGLMTACVHSPTAAHQECHLESGWVDSTNGCSDRADYPDCWKVCADGTRVRVGAQESALPPPSH
jgi:hypothetical protein